MSYRKFYLNLFLFFCFLLPSQLLQAQASCEYSVDLIDTFGDGWNGAVLTINVGGTSEDYTIQSGSEASFTFTVTAGDSIEVSFTGGIFDTEVLYAIYNSEGIIIFADGPVPTMGLAYTGTAECPTCPTPSGIVVDDAGAITADISWNHSGVEGTYFIEYDTIGFTPGTGLLDSSLVNNITLTGLQQDTEYEFYVQQVCPMEDSSNVAGPFTFETIWLVDVGISNILTPQSECGLGLETVTVEILNYGDNPQSLIPFYYSVNGVPAGIPFPTDGLYTGVLSRDSLDEVEFDTESLFSEPGEYVIQAWTELEGDSNPTNDTFTYTIYNLNVNELPTFSDFEDNPGNWSASEDGQASTWAWGDPQGLNLVDAASGENAWVTNLNGNYNNAELSYLISPCFDFSDLQGDPTISFAIFYSTETSYDGCWLETSTDSGETWSKLGALGSGLNWYNFTNFNTNLGDVWAGQSNTWINAEHPLIGLAGEAECRLRFVFDSDGSVNGYDGIGIDNIFVSPPISADLASLSAVTTSGDCGAEDDSIILTIRNNGFEPQTGFDVSYSINNNPPVTENVGSLEILPGEEATYVFNTTFNSAGPTNNFDIQTWVALDNDQNPTNDYFDFQVNTIVATPLPWINDFEDFAVPAGWTTQSFFVGNGHNAPSYVINGNFFGGNPDGEITTHPVGPINPGDSMTFDYRYVDFFDFDNGTVLGAGDFLNVYISIDCGNSFFLLHTIDETNHTPSTEMANVTIDLDGFAGFEIVVRFEANWGTGDYYLDIDNINIQSCPFSFNSDIAITPESASGAGDAGITVTPANGMAPYTYEWSTGDSDASVENLTLGVYTVTITDANLCSETVEIEISACPASLGLMTGFSNASGEITADGSAYVIPDSETGPYTFEWSNGDSGYQIEDIPAGIYSVTVTDINGCADIAEVEVGVSVNVEEIETVQYFGLYPNPATHDVTLEMNFNKSVQLSYQIVNSIGQVVYQKDLGAAKSVMESISVEQFPQGNYFIVIRADGKNHVKQLAVQH